MFGNLGGMESLAWIGGVLIGGAIMIAICIVVGRIILGPLNERAGRLRAPTQFQLSDFFWLVAQVQVALVVSVRMVGIEQLYFFLVVGGFLVLATIAMWIGAVSFMSRAGVTQPLRRAVFILFLLPLTLALMIATALGFLFVAGGALVFVIHRGANTARIFETVPIIVVAVFAIIGCVWGMRQIAIWILAQRPSDNLALGGVTEFAPAKSTTSPLRGA